MAEMKVPVKIGTDFYKTLQRTDVTVDGAFREMIDNSTTSFMDHEEELKRLGENRCCVKIKWDDEKIVVSDNAFGMNREDFFRAFGINRKAKSYSENSRGQYGMGLKYGALALGPAYTIETIEYNSGVKYKGTLDSEILAETLDEEIPAEVIDVMPDKHGTRITIRISKEYRYDKFGTKKIDELMRKLSYIYSDDLRHKRLELWVNDRQVLYNEPIWQKDEDGNDIYHHFSNSFIYEGKEYKYSGWLGQLATGSTYNAGFSLLQKRRAIEINYRPKKIFGGGNTFASQRIFGEIALEGDSWSVSFTKSKIKWDDPSVEEEFVNSLLEIKEVKEIKTLVDKFRANNKSISVNEIKKQAEAEVKKKAKEEKKQEATPIKKESVNLNSNNNKTEIFVVEKEAVSNEEYIEDFEYNGKKYIFHVKENADKIDSLYKLNIVNDKPNEYNLYLNTFYGLFSKNSKTKDERYNNYKIALNLAKAQIQAEVLGLSKDNSQILVNLFMENCKEE